MKHNKEIQPYPKKEYNIESKAKSYIQEKLYDIEISDKEIKDISKQKTEGALIKGIIEQVPILGQVIGKTIEVAEDISNEIENEKIKILLGNVLLDSEDITTELSKVKNFIYDVYGNTIFNKFIKLTNETPLSEAYVAYLHYLSDALKEIISKKDYKQAYIESEYLLQILERLSPSAIIMLAEKKRWADENYESGNGFDVTDGRIFSDWQTDFASHYLRHFSTESGMLTIQSRIIHTITELSSANLVYATPMLIENDQTTEDDEPTFSQKQFTLHCTIPAIDLLKFLKIL